MNLRPFLLAVLFLGACAGRQEALVVKQFQLRDQKRNNGDDPMVGLEKERRLRGAVSMEERKERLGQYYTLLWQDPDGVGKGGVELIFEYQQGSTGSKVKRVVHSFPASDAEGSAEFNVLGDSFFKGGRVLAWKATLRRGGREIATRQSYLWR